MAEFKNIGVISVVVDTEYPRQHQLGEVSAGFKNNDELKEHIRRYGHEGLCAAIAQLNWQVIEAMREVNVEKDHGNNTLPSGLNFKVEDNKIKIIDNKADPEETLS